MPPHPRRRRAEAVGGACAGPRWNSTRERARKQAPPSAIRGRCGRQGGTAGLRAGSPPEDQADAAFPAREAVSCALPRWHLERARGRVRRAPPCPRAVYILGRASGYTKCPTVSRTCARAAGSEAGKRWGEAKGEIH